MAIAAKLQLNPLPLVASIDRSNLRRHIGGAMAAAAAGIYLSSPALTSILFPLALGLFWLSVAVLGRSRPDKVLLGLFAVIVGSAWFSVGPAAYSGEGLAQTLWLAILTTVLLPLAWVRDTKPILQWLTPVWLIQAGVSLFQWVALGPHRVNGIAENTNGGAAFLLLGCVYLLNGNSRARWLILPLVAALPFTGSRWVAVVAAVVVFALFAKRYVDWRYIAVGIAITLGLVFAVGWEDIAATFLRPSTLSGHMMGLEYAHQPDLPPSWIPRGFYDSGIHVIPWRMMHETGILSGLAWAGATAYGLWRRPRYDYRWWLLLTVGLLSAMYYFTWVGPLGWTWWLLVRGEVETRP